MKGLASFMFVMVATIVTVNVSATLFKLSNQLINIEIELNVTNVVLPSSELETDIVYEISIAVQTDNVEVTLNCGIMYEPAA